MRIGLPGGNHGPFTAKPSSWHVHSILPVTLPVPLLVPPFLLTQSLCASMQRLSFLCSAQYDTTKSVVTMSRVHIYSIQQKYHSSCSCFLIDPIHAIILWLHHSLRMAKVHECPLAAVCKVYARREVAFSSFDSLRPQTCGDCTKRLSNNTNGRRKLILSY